MNWEDRAFQLLSEAIKSFPYARGGIIDDPEASIGHRIRTGWNHPGLKKGWWKKYLGRPKPKDTDNGGGDNGKEGGGGKDTPSPLKPGETSNYHKALTDYKNMLATKHGYTDTNRPKHLRIPKPGGQHPEEIAFPITQQDIDVKAQSGGFPDPIKTPTQPTLPRGGPSVPITTKTDPRPQPQVPRPGGGINLKRIASKVKTRTRISSSHDNWEDRTLNMLLELRRRPMPTHFGIDTENYLRGSKAPKGKGSSKASAETFKNTKKEIQQDIERRKKMQGDSDVA